MDNTEEIQHAEFERYAVPLSEALEAVCKSSAFRTSPKSCEFLRYIVGHALRGDTAELKERLLGMALLGREAAYDTGTDAGVRVRANDVRKRLAAYYKTADEDRSFVFELPAGSYVPRFFRIVRIVPSAAPVLAVKPVEVAPVFHESAPPLSLQRLAIPTLIAFFLCTVCLRWQVAEEHPFMSFWQKVFQNHHVTFYLSPRKTESGEDLVAMQELRAADPLFDLAGQFHTRFLLTSNITAGTTDGVLVSIGPITGDRTPAAAGPVNGNRLIVEDTPNGRRILDRRIPGSPVPVPGHAALLTIFNGAQRSIQIDGTDADAIESLVKMLCERDTFPVDVADSLQDRAVTQVLFPQSPNAQTRVFHEPLPLTQAGMAKF